MPLNNALFTVCINKPFEEARSNSELWGRFVESAVGAHLLNTKDDLDLFYWREGNYEVDFILQSGDKLIPIEVKSSTKPASLKGIEKFSHKFPCHQILTVGGQGIPLETFLSKQPSYWFTL